MPENNGALPRLVVDKVSKRFGGVEALRDVSLEAEASGLTGIVGPNGAGKTTLLNVMTSFLIPDRGSVRLDGYELKGRPSERVVRAGLARTFQEMRLFDSLSVLDNVRLASHFGARRSRNASVRAHDGHEEILERLDLNDFRRIPARDLSYGIQKRVALARAVATGAVFLALDEPLAGLSPHEVDHFLELMRDLSGTRGLLVVEHNLPALTSVASRLIVLHDGSLLAAGDPREVMARPEVRTAYLGEAA